MMKLVKSILVPAVLLILLISGLFYALDLKVVKTSSQELDFEPGEVATVTQRSVESDKPKNIILFIADGLGFSHLSIAMLSQQEKGTPSVWDQFVIRGWHDTRSVYGPLTDSEASATAMSTGVSTNFGFIGLDPDGNPVKNVFELASELQYNTAIVTDSYIWDGTPAAFVAHTKTEDDARDILKQIASSELDLLFGELEDLGEGLVPELEETLEILSTRFTLLDRSLTLPARDSVLRPIAAIYEEDEVQDLESSPNLTELTDLALSYITSSNKPFIMLVESEEMDAASHENDSDRVIKGMRSIQETVVRILSFAENDGETLLIFTSDHEAGGLAIVSEEDYPNMQLRWSTKDHTTEAVPLFVYGPGAEAFEDVNRNWQIGRILKSLISQ